MPFAAAFLCFVCVAAFAVLCATGAGVVATDFGKNALFGGPDSRTLPGAQPVEDVARVIADAIGGGPADVYTRPDGLEVVLGHVRRLAGAQ